MKIICVEEHVVDGRVMQALAPALVQQAPYLADVGSTYVDDPDGFGDDRPHLNPRKRVHEIQADVGAGRLADMDRHGIDMHVLSHSTLAQLAPVASAVDLVRGANDRMAEAVHAHPDRFAGFAALPWQTPDAAVIELERAVTELGLKGTLLNGRPGERFLDDPRYAGVLAKHAELGVPLYLHPGFVSPEVHACYYAGLLKEVSARLGMFAWGWHGEAGVHLIRLILAGVFDRNPGLQVISGHWGEMVPFYLQRLDDMLPVGATGLSRTISETFRSHVYVTPAGMLNRPHFAFIHEVVGADRILYSIDYPYLTQTGARAFLENLLIPEDDKELIAHGNAERLLKL